MLDRLFGYPAHTYLHFVGAIIVAIGLPLNKVVMSVGTIWLIANVVLLADYKTYWKKIKENTVIKLIIGLFLFHLIGLLWSEDIGYGLRDIRSKLPFLTFRSQYFAVKRQAITLCHSVISTHSSSFL